MKWQAGIVILLVLLAVVVGSCAYQGNTTPVISEHGNTVEEITLSLGDHESDNADNSTLPAEQSASEPVDNGPDVTSSSNNPKSGDADGVSLIVTSGVSDFESTSPGLNSSSAICEPPPSADNTTLTTAPQIDIGTLEKQIHDGINAERAKQGLASLAWDPELNVIARKHSEDMVRRNYFNHISPEGYTLLNRCQQAGYQVSRGVAENIFQCTLAKCDWYRNGILWYTEYYTQGDIALLVVNGWMNSPGHRQNILTNYWSAEGIGVGISTDGKVYITEDFS